MPELRASSPPIDPDDARRLITAAFADHPTRRFAIRLWDGSEVEWGQPRDFTLAFADPHTFLSCMASADPAELAEAYVDRRMRIEGDLWGAIGLASHLWRRVPADREPRAAPARLTVSSTRTIEQDVEDVRSHYDLPDELFRSFLDERMVYSCAYFATPSQSLERAQERKLDMICRKLRLRPGDALLDVGCGWGALVLWAAQRYGVRAHGITLSVKQAAEARARVARAGLEDRVTIEQRHYAELAGSGLEFDKVASIGMVEHVGAARLPEYLRAIDRVLRPGGLLVNHGITQSRRERERPGGPFVLRHVFPGAYLDDLGHLVSAMEDVGFEVVDVQSLRPHYALTLARWFERFEARRSEAARFVPDRTLRVWDLYLAGCARAFEQGLVGVHQLLLAKPDHEGRITATLTREEMALPPTTDPTADPR
jgi:cyclopropane-fatty-acyl-phospholipid synthase